MSLKELLNYCFEHGLNGKQTDNCIILSAGNYIRPEIPVLSIKVASLKELFIMLRKADSTHLFIEGGIFYFNALYNHTNEFPSPRIYFIKTPYLDYVAQIGITLQKSGIQFPFINGEKFSKLIEEKLYSERYRIWLFSRNKRYKLFKNLVLGRQASTTLNNSIWLDTNGCLLCGNEQFLMYTTTIVADESALMIGLKLCEIHSTESRNSKTSLKYLAEKFEIPTPSYLTSLKSLNSAETIAMSLECIQKKLECTIEKMAGNTITALRKTGFRIIFRQEATDNYAYNIQDPNGKLVARIDSANHHKVNYGPDHVHYNLSRACKNQVETSFTYGIVLTDIKAIKKFTEHAESNYANQ